jgi:hypothetical protein
MLPRNLRIGLILQLPLTTRTVKLVVVEASMLMEPSIADQEALPTIGTPAISTVTPIALMVIARRV